MSSEFDRPKPGAHQPTRWQSGPVDEATLRTRALPLITAQDVRSIAPHMDFWDMWPLARDDGSTVLLQGRSWWFFLGAPSSEDPEGRHDHARIHLVSRGRGGWSDHGRVLPTELDPGTREWSGSAVLGPDGKAITLYFTAAGRRTGGPRFEQRLFAATGMFNPSAASTSNWSEPVEIVKADGSVYAVAEDSEPIQGLIRGFRDPTYFRDPRTASEYVLFTGNSGRDVGDYNGVIGVAERLASQWILRPPLVDATGFNHELERAHMLMCNGLYYLFWSTHASRFAPGVSYPTGLFGMVSEHALGPWRPLNGNTLVACNPPEEPTQAYCWWVTGELEVVSFVNYWGLHGRRLETDARLPRQSFGGTAAPPFALELHGDKAKIVANARR